MDKQTRNLIQKATQDARNLLEIEFSEQLEGVFDILPNRQIAPELGKHLNVRSEIRGGGNWEDEGVYGRRGSLRTDL